MLLAVDGEDPVAVLILESEGDGQRFVVNAAVLCRLAKRYWQKSARFRPSDATCFSDLCNLDTVHNSDMETPWCIIILALGDQYLFATLCHVISSDKIL